MLDHQLHDLVPVVMKPVKRHFIAYPAEYDHKTCQSQCEARQVNEGESPVSDQYPDGYFEVRSPHTVFFKDFANLVPMTSMH
jgi:hypothetical protein